jgi:hypothetical protein
MCFCPSDEYNIQAYQKRAVHAAREYRCEECGDTIKIGEQHAYHFQICDGDPGSWRTCMECTWWGIAFSAKSEEVCGCSGWTIGGMWDAIGEFMIEHEADLKEAA